MQLVVETFSEFLGLANEVKIDSYPSAGYYSVQNQIIASRCMHAYELSVLAL